MGHTLRFLKPQSFEQGGKEGEDRAGQDTAASQQRWEQDWGPRSRAGVLGRGSSLQAGLEKSLF